ncbi:MAG: MerR family transcriptional regulator [Candidatus Geothermincolia bacterium]
MPDKGTSVPAVERPSKNVRTAKRLLKIKQISQATGVSTSAINYYVRMGLLPPPVKTYPNMAYYDEAYVPMIRYIKRLQEEKHLPLKRIKELMERKVKIWNELGEGALTSTLELESEEMVYEPHEAVRRQIIEAGMKLFAGNGVFAAKIMDIAKEAGISVGEFYNHFSGKEDLFLEIAEDYVMRFREEERSLRGETDMLEQLRRSIPISFKHIVGNRELFSLVLEESLLDDITYESKIRRLQDLITSDLARLLKRGKSDGSLKLTDPTLTANAIMGMVVRVSYYWLENASRLKADDVIQQTVDFVVRALKP